MPKKPVRNNFYFFILDFKDAEAKKGRFLNMKEASYEAGNVWKYMGPAERKPYDLKAQKAKDGEKAKKYTSSGEDINVVLKREREKKEKIIFLQKAVEKLVLNSPDITEENFFVCYMNYYCYCSSNGQYIPAEISIVRFNLREGVNLDEIYHVILDTGVLPLGYRLAAETVAKESHNIPVPPHEDDYICEISEKDMEKVLTSMIDFLRASVGRYDRIPPIFVEDQNIPTVTDVLERMIDTYGDPDTQDIPIYSLTQLFFQLRNVARRDSFPVTLAKEELDKDIYDYVTDIACDFHKIIDAYKHCSLSKCIRKIFTICDFTNKLMNLPLIPGRHVPKNASLKKLLKQACDFKLDDEEPSTSSTNVNKKFQQNPSYNSKTPQASSSSSLPSSSSSASQPSSSKPASLPSSSKSSKTQVGNSKGPAWNTMAQVVSSKPQVTNSSAQTANTEAQATRPPMTTSFAQTFNNNKNQPMSFINNSNDFPALGVKSESRPKPAVMGRGRGRFNDKQ